MKKNGLIIAIDGPAAVGKSTMGKLIARELGFLYIDTGAIYRAITWKVLKNNININDEDMISSVVSDTCITIERANSKKLIYLQRELAEKGNIVMEGRDIGSVILPQADIKFYFTASEEERINRRYKELIDKDYSIDYEIVKKQIIQRDKIDSKRKYAPLIKAKDAILIDSTEKSIEEVKDNILKIIKKF
jgi:cytidylate kinase